MLSALMVLLAATLASTEVSAKGIGLLDMESCVYNGKQLNLGIAKETNTATPKVARDFTGTAVCYDVRTKARSQEVEIRKGKKHGWLRKFDTRTGKLAEEVFYAKGSREGLLNRYDHRNGKLKLRWSFRKDKQHGVQKEFHSETGQLKRVYWTSSPRPSGKATNVKFNKDGSLSQLTCGPQVISTQDSAWCGRDGKSSEVVLYSLSGGKAWPREIVHYNKNVVHGEKLTLHRDGFVLRKETYKKGTKISSESFKDGKTVHVEEYVGGKRSGEEVAYFEGTKKRKVVVEWKKGKRVKQEDFYMNGQLSRLLEVGKKGKATINEYRDTGVPFSEGTYIFGGSRWWSRWLPDGKITYYYQDGKVRSRSEYKAGQAEGKRTLHDPGGWVAREEHYADGSITRSIDYDNRGKVLCDASYHEDRSIKKLNKGRLIL